ncbi:hypothetical protein GIB67_021719 [Kingdonia uniflora]|uniref:E3 ubiquitin-protein ligase LIN-1 n=1 Tax=Kingdonia uniflora TaxID=39325 RepID=A0A7J7LMB9_9MAGN|nr:hypothetical protein GIB67_021719 [Kingdonia uniflora]
MASSSTSNDRERLTLETVQILILSVNQYIRKFLEDEAIRKSLKFKCISKLKIQKQESFEFSDHSVLSNLYWGIESVEAAVQAKWSEERILQLKNAEQKLQVPASLDEYGRTGGIKNKYLVCSSYFYLCLVRKLERDEWQVTLHFLQALLVYPRLIRKKFTPELWKKIFLSQILESGILVALADDEIDEETKKLARRYKGWLMYYQVMLYGETATQLQCENRVNSMLDEGSSSVTSYGKSISRKYLNSLEWGNSGEMFKGGEKVHPLGLQEHASDDMEDRKASKVILKPKKTPSTVDILKEFYFGGNKANLEVKCLQDILKESQSDTTISVSSYNVSTEGSDSETYDSQTTENYTLWVKGQDTSIQIRILDFWEMKSHIPTQEKIDYSNSSVRIATIEPQDTQQEIRNGKLHSTCSEPNQKHTKITSPQSSQYLIHNEQYEVNRSNLFSSRFYNSILNLPIPKVRDVNSNTCYNWHIEQEKILKSELGDVKVSNHIPPTSSKQYNFNRADHQSISLNFDSDIHLEMMRTFEKAISTLYFRECVETYDEDKHVEVSIMWEILTNTTEEKYCMLKDVILDKLLNAISTSKEERVIRASVSILSTIISKNDMVIEDIKKRGLSLCDLASALKRNVHEAAILIYLINPSPGEMKSLELLPALLEVACNSNKEKPKSFWLTPPAASLMMIEVLITASDYTTNNVHLDAISSPPVLSRLVNTAIDRDLEEVITLVDIFIKCMKYDGKCRNFISQFASIAPFVHLLASKKNRAKFIGLQFFHELLCMPRSSAITILHQMRKTDSIDIMHTLMSFIQHSQPEFRLFAANLLLQLDILEDSSYSKSKFREEAMKVLLEAIASDESSEELMLSAFILSNLGGTYAWTGEPYTAAWLVKKTGLTSPFHRNVIRNYDWSDQSLQDDGVDAWCSRIAKSVMKIGDPIFHALERGLHSKIKSVSRDCLIATSWIGYEIAKSPSNLRYSACEIILSGIERFLHPGSELDERLLACLTIYNYASGKGMQKLMHFSEGVRESLRRLSSVTWMAEELLRVTDYFLPTKARVSCVHTQTLEVGRNCCGAATALTIYKGQLYSGYSDGSIKVWDIKGQTSTLVWDVKEHKKAVTSFALYEPRDTLLSGSTDRTIKVWQMVQKKLECVEVIEAKDPVHTLDTYDNLIFAITKCRGIKVFDASRKVKIIFKSKNVKCMAVVQGKLYLGCKDSSIQEVDIENKREREIKAPAKFWRMQTRPINSVLAYRDWLYSASNKVEGSNLKEWRRRKDPQISISLGKGENIKATAIVEDFIYLTCSSSPSILEVWLRGMQKKVGTLSAGSRITSLLTANDIVICGTETGLIKGWISL